jgi:hypothetical protein
VGQGSSKKICAKHTGKGIVERYFFNFHLTVDCQNGILIASLKKLFFKVNDLTVSVDCYFFKVSNTTEIVIMNKPRKVMAQIEKYFNEIEELNPTPAEIEAFGDEKFEEMYGAISITNAIGYFRPKIHNTWRLKFGGRVHIDIGSGGYHIMLAKWAAPYFIEFIKKHRNEEENLRKNGDLW